jgi:hypothetical protein
VSSSDGHLKRLIAIAGMLGSDHDGERANAARLATLELRRLGLTWAELIGRAFQALTAPARQEPLPGFQEGWEPQRQPPRSYPGKRSASKEGIKLWEFVRYASLRPQQMTSWEAGFVKGFLEIGPKATATEAQWRILLQIAEKLNVAA